MLGVGQSIFDIFYPIGTYYETSNTNFDPNTANSWYGTWVEDTSGRNTVALDTTQTEFNSVGKIGGSKFLQNHYHDIRWGAYDGRGVTISTTGSGSSVLDIPNWNWNNNGENSKGSGANLYTNVEGTGNSGNLQPYIVVKRWHRIA